MPYHISSSNKVVDCKAKKRPCPRKNYETKEAAQQVADFKQQIENQKPKAAVFPPAPDNLVELHRQAAIYAKTDLWNSKFKEYEEEYRKGFVTVYKQGDTNNSYTRKNMYDLSDSAMRVEAYKAGRARASYVLNLAKKNKIEFIEQPMSYFGEKEHPFENKHMLYNPIKKGQKVVIPAGTRYQTTGKEGKGVTKRATTITVETTNKGYTDGSVHKRFVTPPQITAAGAGGYWKRFTVTPEMLEKNNLPIRETLETGMLDLSNNRDGINT